MEAREHDQSRPPDQGAPDGAPAPAAPARREGRADAQHAVPDRVGAPHAVAPYAREAGGRLRSPHRLAVRGRAQWPASREPQDRLSGGVLRRHLGEMACAGGGALSGQDPGGDVLARPPGQRRQDRQGDPGSRADEALLCDRGQGGALLQRRDPPAGGRGQRLSRRRHPAWLGERGRQGRQGALGDPGLDACRRKDGRMTDSERVMVDFRTEPSKYKHWKLSIDGRVATLAMDVKEDGGLRPGYELKLNSYDLGVDIELYDAVQRLRFEHPEVGAVVVTSAKERVFCAGANIRMLSQSSHGWKVNFCKFTNETRNAIEDATAHSRQFYLCAINGPCAGGGYELALASDYIIMADDGSTTVALPEVPLLAVLPGTGGLTRLVDKRRVRRDRADFFSTLEGGLKGERAVEWRLVDQVVPRSQLDETVRRRAAELAARSDRPAGARGIPLEPLARTIEGERVAYSQVTCQLDRERGIAEITVSAPTGPPPADPPGIRAAGCAFWPLAVARELDDLILHLRTNEDAVGLWVFRTAGRGDLLEAYDRALLDHASDWLVREIRLYLKRTLKRLDVSSRSIFALIEPGSCFTGTLLELALAADRSYMLYGAREGDAKPPASVRLTGMNFGPYPMVNGLTRLESRFLAEPGRVDDLKGRVGKELEAAAAAEAGLVTFTPDDIDWDDEVRIGMEERVAFSPDALTGREASLRFGGPETLESKIFSRLSAWQNWIFQRPNAVGPKGALKVYGTGERSDFDRGRV